MALDNLRNSVYTTKCLCNDDSLEGRSGSRAAEMVTETVTVEMVDDGRR